MADKQAVFWVHGISCLDCAATFEQHVAALPGVTGVNLNTTTGKLSVYGAADLNAIRKLGRAEDYTIGTNRDDGAGAEASAAKAELLRVVGAGVLLVAASFVSRWTASRVDGAVGAAIGVNVDTLRTILLFGAIVVGGWSNARRAYYALPRLDFNMSVLMTIAVIGAMAIGEWTEGAVVAFLFAVSDMLEAWTYGRARRSIRELMQSAPKRARVRRGDVEADVSVEEIDVGDVVVIRPGEKIPVDGVITQGASAIDEAPITGESIPVEKEPGATVFAGTLNTYGALEVRVTKPFTETTIAKIVRLVEEAEGKRATSQAFVDRFAAVYTPIVIALAALIAVLPPVLFGGEWGAWVYRGLALLVVACPCALVIATPVSIVSAISNAARRGVLIKGGVYLEELAGLNAVAFDKTGTLTVGKPVVTDVIVLGASNEGKQSGTIDERPGEGAGVPALGEADLLRIAVGLESRSEHPIATAIVRAGEERGIDPAPVQQFRALPGRGVEGCIDEPARIAPGQTVYAGNRRLFEEFGVIDASVTAEIARLQGQGKTTVIIGTHTELFGLIAVADEPRPYVAGTIAALKEAGIGQTIMLTGDNAQAAQAVAAYVGIDDVRAELLPEHKVQVVTDLLATQGKVAMIGDGVNDAPALAGATVGIAMGGAGTDAALETADVVLMGDDLSKLPYLLRLSRTTLRVIKQNINFALLIKLVAVLAVFPGWLTLWLAILADMGATVIVTLNGMRLLAHGTRSQPFTPAQKIGESELTPPTSD